MKKYNVILILAFLFSYCNNHKFGKFSKKEDQINILNTDQDNEEKHRILEIDLTLTDTFDKNKNSNKEEILLKKNPLTAKEYNDLSESEKDKVREGDFKKGELRLLNGDEIYRIRLNGINDPGKAFCCIKMKKKKYVHRFQSSILLLLEIGVLVSKVTIDIENFKTEYYTSQYCPNEKFKNKLDCLSRCGEDCKLVYKDGLEYLSTIILSLTSIALLYTLRYFLWSLYPYFINSPKCIKNACKPFGADTSEERYANLSDSNSKEEEI